MQDTRCEFCKVQLLPHEFGLHICRDMSQLSRTSRTLKNPATGKVTSVIKHTSDIKYTRRQRTAISSYIIEGCEKAMARIYRNIEIEFAKPSTSSAYCLSTKSRNNERTPVNTLSNSYSTCRPNVTETSNNPSSLENRNGKSSRSQTSNVPQVNTEAGTSVSNLKAGTYATVSSESATIVSKSAVQHLKESSATAMTRMMSKMRQYTASSSRLGNTSTQETGTPRIQKKPTQFIYRHIAARSKIIRSLKYKCGPSMRNRSLQATQKNLEQAATSGPDLETENVSGGPSGSSQGADSAPFLRNLLSNQQAATSCPALEEGNFFGGPSGSSLGVDSAPILQNLLNEEKPQQAATSAPALETRNISEAPSSSQGEKSAPFLRNLLNEEKQQQFYCRLCKINYRSWENLDLHIDSLVAAGITNTMAHNHSPHYRRTDFFACHFCEEKFDTKSAYDSHWDFNHKVNIHKCIYCERKYMMELNLTTHENSKHEGKTIFKCSECYKRFFSAILLALHQCDQ